MRAPFLVTRRPARARVTVSPGGTAGAVRAGWWGVGTRRAKQAGERSPDADETRPRARRCQGFRPLLSRHELAPGRRALSATARRGPATE
ncbi:Ribonucleases P/MRP protein subunit POP1 [Actinacidiphila cocklensis]|uniref:Ribonucleases P/MRP protein subunit POP1 n=1 Tax=Actinacidiphila cocklensis TaxID=887465 RepID=A0A9W4EBJ3_9ACTN|nr:Ribonucleases P/MRP protein subunit POP1 [Actinacidiphila cocklensis]